MFVELCVWCCLHGSYGLPFLVRLIGLVVVCFVCFGSVCVLCWCMCVVSCACLFVFCELDLFGLFGLFVSFVMCGLSDICACVLRVWLGLFLGLSCTCCLFCVVWFGCFVWCSYIVWFGCVLSY